MEDVTDLSQRFMQYFRSKIAPASFICNVTVRICSDESTIYSNVVFLWSYDNVCVFQKEEDRSLVLKGAFVSEKTENSAKISNIQDESMYISCSSIQTWLNAVSIFGVRERRETLGGETCQSSSGNVESTELDALVTDLRSSSSRRPSIALGQGSMTLPEAVKQVETRATATDENEEEGEEEEVVEEPPLYQISKKLMEILNDKYLYERLLHWAVRERCHEAVMFVKDCLKFKLYEEEEERREWFKFLMENYVSEEGTRLINIGGKTRKNLMKLVDEGSFGPVVFEGAVKEVAKVLELDSIPKFERELRDRTCQCCEQITDEKGQPCLKCSKKVCTRCVDLFVCDKCRGTPCAGFGDTFTCVCCKREQPRADCFDCKKCQKSTCKSCLNLGSCHRCRDVGCIADFSSKPSTLTRGASSSAVPPERMRRMTRDRSSSVDVVRKGFKNIMSSKGSGETTPEVRKKETESSHLRLRKTNSAKSLPGLPLNRVMKTKKVSQDQTEDPVERIRPRSPTVSGVVSPFHEPVSPNNKQRGSSMKSRVQKIPPAVGDIFTDSKGSPAGSPSSPTQKSPKSPIGIPQNRSRFSRSGSNIVVEPFDGGVEASKDLEDSSRGVVLPSESTSVESNNGGGAAGFLQYMSEDVSPQRIGSPGQIRAGGHKALSVSSKETSPSEIISSSAESNFAKSPPSAKKPSPVTMSFSSSPKLNKISPPSPLVSPPLASPDTSPPPKHRDVSPPKTPPIQIGGSRRDRSASVSERPRLPQKPITQTRSGGLTRNSIKKNNE